MEHVNYDELLSLSTEIGWRLLENGGEIYRVEESIQRILEAYGIRGGDVFTIPSCIIVTINDDSGRSLTRIKRIRSLGVNVSKVDLLNDLCRRICRDKPELAEIRTGLQQIEERKRYPFPVQVWAVASISFSFTFFYGGILPDAICAFAIGILLKLLLFLLQRFQANSFFCNMIGSFLVASLCLISVHLGLAFNYDKMIIGTLMNLVPGVAITNVMRDIIAGDLIAGIIKLTEALMVATAIALGAGIAISLLRPYIIV